jgi:hypothetical protein
MALASRTPSMIEAWLSWSLMTMSSSPSSVAGTASLAFHALTKESAAGVPTSRAHAASRARCTVKVPQMNRTEAVPAPQRSSAALPAAITSGSPLSPR